MSSEKYPFICFLLILIIFIIIRTIKSKQFNIKLSNTRVSDGIDGISKFLLTLFVNTQSILLPMCIYTIILISFSILLPDLWGKYWGNQEFFWISQVYLGAMIALKWVNIASVRFVLRVAFSVIIAVYLYDKMPHQEKIETQQTQKKETVEFYGNKLATIGHEWSQEFGIPKSGGIMRIKRSDPEIPLECLVTLDDRKEIFEIPGVREGGGDFNLPDLKRLRIRVNPPSTPSTTTTVWIITKPL